MPSSSSISSLGVGSGLDLSSLLDSLQSSEQTRLQPLQSRLSSFNTQLSAYGRLTNSVNNLQSAADKLNDASLYQSTQVSTSGDAFTASSSKEAVPGSYSVSVTQLAQAQSLVAPAVADSAAALGTGGTITITTGDNDPVDIEIGEDNASLEDVRDAINAAGAGVSASIINDGSDTPYRLVLSSNDPGTDNQINISATDAAGGSGTQLSDVLGYDSAAGSGAMTETVAAQDAKLSVNGIDITRSSNTVEDAIQGVTLSLTGTTDADSPQSLTTTRDNDTIKGALTKFISAYNSYRSTADNLTAYNADANSGVLLGDSTARSVASRIRESLNTSVEGGDLSMLSDVGISLQTDGSLKVDDEKLDAALNNDPRGVARLFSGDLASDVEDDGVAGAVSSAIAAMTDDNGLLSAASDGVQRSIDSVNDRMDQMQASIDSEIERYRQQFVQLDSLMSDLNSTQSYLTTQLSQLNSSSD